MMERFSKLPVISINRLRMSIDGRGVRTLIGVFGCPLRCKYCLNPISWNQVKTPTLYSVDDLYDIVYLDNIYYQATNGGLTFGGGEPLLYSHFIKEFSERCPREWTLFAETSLHVPWENVNEIKDVIDHFIIDIKTLDDVVYHNYTGGSLTLALNNLKRLISQLGTSKLTVRVPIIEGFADIDSQKRTITLLQDMGITDIDAFCYLITKK